MSTVDKIGACVFLLSMLGLVYCFWKFFDDWEKSNKRRAAIRRSQTY